MPWAAVLLPCAKISRTGEHLAASHGLGWPGALQFTKKFLVTTGDGATTPQGLEFCSQLYSSDSLAGQSRTWFHSVTAS